MPKPFSPLVITKFLGENDVIPATEMEDAQCSLAQNLYIVQGGLERRLGTAATNTSLGSSKAVQGMLWCKLDPTLAGAGYDAADGAIAGVMLDPLDSTVSADIQLYLRADQVTAANGAVVATWPDLSGFARDAVQATAGNKPIARDAYSVNGRRMIEWDGVDDLMVSTIPAFPPGIPNTNGYTWYAYINETALTTGGFNTQMLCGSSGMELMTRTSVIAGYGQEQKYGMRATARSPFGATATGAQTVTGIFASPGGVGGLYRCFVNGTQTGSDATDWSQTMAGTFLVGNNGGANTSFIGYIGAIIVYSATHSTATRQAIERWLVNFFEG